MSLSEQSVNLAELPNMTSSYNSYLDVNLMVKPWLRIPLTETDYDFILNMITDGVCTACQRFIGGPIAPKVYGPWDGLGKFDGAGGLQSGYIMLPRTPVVAIVEVIEYNAETPVTLYEISDPGNGTTLPNGSKTYDGYQINYRTGRMTRVLGGIWNRPFMPGSQNVWVTWLAGFNPVPTDILEVSLEWIAHKFKTGFETQEDHAPSPGEQYGSSTSSDGMYTGIPNEVREVLQTYITPGIGG